MRRARTIFEDVTTAKIVIAVTLLQFDQTRIGYTLLRQEINIGMAIPCQDTFHSRTSRTGNPGHGCNLPSVTSDRCFHNSVG